MKKITLTLIINLILLLGFTLVVNAVQPKYSVHTSGKDIEYKKQKALSWHEDNVDNKKFYWYDANKHINWLKTRSIRWYDDHITNGKYYFVHAEHETAFTKNKALKWHDRNSQ